MPRQGRGRGRGPQTDDENRGFVGALLSGTLAWIGGGLGFLAGWRRWMGGRWGGSAVFGGLKAELGWAEDKQYPRLLLKPKYQTRNTKP